MTAIVVAAWLGLALVLTVVMARRGHDVFQWALLGVVLGPLAVPLAVAHREKVVVPPTGGGAGTHGVGRVLVGVRPGTTPVEVASALGRLTTLAGPVPVTVAAVLDAEACERPAGRQAIADTEQFLATVAAALVDAGVASSPVERTVLFGDPATALSTLAEQGSFALVAVGAGEPLTRRAMHGSTRSRLLRSATVPVLCVPGHSPSHRRARKSGAGVPAGRA